MSLAFNTLVPNAPFLYPLKTENRTVFWCFQEVEKACIGNEWVNPFHTTVAILYPPKTKKQRFRGVLRGYYEKPVAWDELNNKVFYGINRSTFVSSYSVI